MASSVRSTNSQGLKRCMVNRTHEDAIDETKSIQNKKLYKTRISERLKTAGTSRLTISFGSVEIREYPMILGFNPAVSQVSCSTCVFSYFVFFIHYFFIFSSHVYHFTSNKPKGTTIGNCLGTCRTRETFIGSI